MSRRSIIPAALAAATLTLAACGGSASPEDAVRAQVKGFVSDLRAGDTGKACARAADPPTCIANVAMAAAFVGGNDSLVALIPDDAGDGPVKITGDRATLGDTTLVKRDGEWKIVME